MKVIVEGKHYDLPTNSLLVYELDLSGEESLDVTGMWNVLFQGNTVNPSYLFGQWHSVRSRAGAEALDNKILVSLMLLMDALLCCRQPDGATTPVWEMLVATWISRLEDSLWNNTTLTDTRLLHCACLSDTLRARTVRLLGPGRLSALNLLELHWLIHTVCDGYLTYSVLGGTYVIDSDTALTLSIKNNHTQASQMIIRACPHQINIAERQDPQRSPLLIALGFLANYQTDMGRLDLVNQLLDHQNIDINAASSSGETALLLATERGMDKIVRKLLDRGADCTGLPERLAQHKINVLERQRTHWLLQNSARSEIDQAIGRYRQIVVDILDMKNKNMQGPCRK
jgi:hypothetical protein